MAAQYQKGPQNFLQFKREQLHGGPVRVTADLPGTSTAYAFLYRKCITRKCVTLKMKVKVTKYNMCNGLIQ